MVVLWKGISKQVRSIEYKLEVSGGAVRNLVVSSSAMRRKTVVRREVRSSVGIELPEKSSMQSEALE